MNNTRNAAVLCGDLNMLRCFSGTGIHRVAVSSDPQDLIFQSRYTKQKWLVADPLTQPERTIDDLIRLSMSFAEKPVLFYGDDPTLLAISRNRERLEPHYHFLMPDSVVIEDLVNKVRFSELADRLQLPVPRTILGASVSSADEVLKQMELPCIIKPNCHVGWFRSSIIREEGGRPQKVLRADTAEEFRRLFSRMKTLTNDFVVQEYIAGTDDCIYSFHAYLDRQSRPLAYYVGRKVRTYPSDSGISTCLELVKEPRVVDLGLDILRKLGHVGPVKLDFKRDTIRDRFWLLEVNARFNLWHYLGTACGINIPLIAYCDQMRMPVPMESEYRTGVRWVSFMDDLRAFVLDYHPRRLVSWPEYIRSFCCEKVYDIFAWNDPFPAAVAVTRDLKLRAQKLIHRLVPAALAKPLPSQGVKTVQETAISATSTAKGGVR